MKRSKGSFRNGHKKGARSNLHNLRSSANPASWGNRGEIVDMPIEEAIEELQVMVEDPVVEPAPKPEPVIEPKKKRGRPKRNG